MTLASDANWGSMPAVEKTTEAMAARYREVMGDVDREARYYDFDKQRFSVRQWDGSDGCWSDIATDVSGQEALRLWSDYTKDGTERIRFSQLDYVRLFPAGTQMVWDGTPGREAFRTPSDDD